MSFIGSFTLLWMSKTQVSPPVREEPRHILKWIKRMISEVSESAPERMGKKQIPKVTRLQKERAHTGLSD